METLMPFYKELVAAAGSNYVKDTMTEKFQREVTALRLDELELTKKAQEIRARVAEREFVLKESELLFPFESTLQSMLALNNLQTEDLKEAAEILVAVMKKNTPQAKLLSFIKRLKSLPY